MNSAMDDEFNMACNGHGGVRSAQGTTQPPPLGRWFHQQEEFFVSRSWRVPLFFFLSFFPPGREIFHFGDDLMMVGGRVKKKSDT